MHCIASPGIVTVRMKDPIPTPVASSSDVNTTANSNNSNKRDQKISPMRRRTLGASLSPRRSRSDGGGSKSPVRDSSKTKKPAAKKASRRNSFSPFELIKGVAEDRKKKNLHIVPEALNESSSGSFHYMSSSATFKQEQMIHAFGNMDKSGNPLILLDDPDDLQQQAFQNLDSKSGSSLFLMDGPEDVIPQQPDNNTSYDIASTGLPEQIQVKTKRRTSAKIKEIDLPIKIEETDRENDDTEHESDQEKDLVADPPSRIRTSDDAHNENDGKRSASLDDYLIRETPSSHARTSSRRSSHNSYNTRQSGTSSTLGSAVSQISYTSMTSFNSTMSMPSLSSILEHDLQSVATAGTGGNSTVHTGTSSIATSNLSVSSSGELPSIASSSAASAPPGRRMIATGSNEQPILLSLTPPPGDETRNRLSLTPPPGDETRNRLSLTPPPGDETRNRMMSAPTDSSSSDASSLTNPPIARQKRVQVVSHQANNNTSPTSRVDITTPDLHRELYHLEGTTLEELGPNIQNPHKNLPQQRWESDTIPKKKASPFSTNTPINTSSITAATEEESLPVADHGNRDVAPLTHDQKNMLPAMKTPDMQPIYVARRDSDASNCSSAIDALFQGAPDIGSPSGMLEEHSPAPMSRPSVSQRYALSNNRQDTIPMVAQRMSSTSIMTPPLGMGSSSLMEMPAHSPWGTKSSSTLDSESLAAANKSSSLDSESLVAAISPEDEQQQYEQQQYEQQQQQQQQFPPNSDLMRVPRTAATRRQADRNGMPRTLSTDSLGLPPKPSRPASPPSMRP